MRWCPRQAVIARTIAFALVAGAAIVIFIASGRDHPGSVTVYRTADHKRLWKRDVDGGFVVVLAVTQQSALVADGDDCIHDGMASVELVTPTGTSFIASVSGCVVFNWAARVHPVRIELPPTPGGDLVAVLPPVLGGGRVSLPCPCPKATGNLPDDALAVAGPGAYAIPSLGTFVAGHD